MMIMRNYNRKLHNIITKCNKVWNVKCVWYGITNKKMKNKWLDW